MTDSIELRNIRVWGKHGVTPEEKECAQPFDIDIFIETDLNLAQASDELSDTIDYSKLHQEITKIVSTTSYNLLETLAGKILESIFVDKRAKSASISVAKPERLKGAIPVVTLKRFNPTL